MSRKGMQWHTVDMQSNEGGRTKFQMIQSFKIIIKYMTNVLYILFQISGVRRSGLGKPASHPEMHSVVPRGTDRKP
jgi:hypothetical protein